MPCRAHRFCQLLIASLWLCVYTPASLSADATIITENHAHSVRPDWMLEPGFLDLQEFLQAALTADKHGLFVLYTTAGCSYCELFIRESLHNPAIAEQLQASFDTLELEIFDDREMTSPSGQSLSVKAFAQQEHAGMAPTLLFYDASGSLAFRAIGYQNPQRFSAMINFVASNTDPNLSFRDYYATTQRIDNGNYPQLLDDPLFITPPYALDRSRFAASQPLLVIWETPGCEDCRVLHQRVLQDKPLRQILTKFDVVRLDIADAKTALLTPDGKRTTPSQWYQSQGLSHQPAYQFFTRDGKEVLRIDALALEGRLKNSLNYLLTQAHDQGLSYQQFARSQARQRNGLD